jgi:hypothetical protein
MTETMSDSIRYWMSPHRFEPEEQPMTDEQRSRAMAKRKTKQQRIDEERAAIENCLDDMSSEDYWSLAAAMQRINAADAAEILHRNGVRAKEQDNG